MALVAEGKPDEAARSFQESVSLAHALPDPYAEARGLYVWGRAEVTLDGELMESGRARLSEALAIFQRLGAEPYARWTEHALL
jgi:hypothetical protein